MGNNSESGIKGGVIEDVSPVKKKIDLKLDKKRADESFNKKVADASKKSSLKGFRPGKAPLSVIKKYYGDELYEEAVSEVLNEDFRKIIADNDVHVVGVPRLEKKQPAEGESGNEEVYTVNFEIMPSINELNMDLKIKKFEKREITEDVIKEEVSFLLERAATSVPLEESAAINAEDKYFVKIDYITVDNETDKEVDSAKDYSISLNSKIIDKSFEESMLGKKVGDQFEYLDKERKVTVKGVIKEIDKKIIPELNLETIKNFGEFKDIDEFKKYVEKNLLSYEEKRYDEQMKAEISDELVKLNPTEFPDSVIEENAVARLKELKKQGRYKEGDKKSEAELMQVLRIMAKRELTLYLLLSEISRREDISVQDEDLDAFFKKTASESNIKEDEIKKFYSEKEAVINLRHSLMEDKIFDFLISNKVSYI